MEVYKSLIVRELEVFYGNLLTSFRVFPNIQSHLEVISKKMWEGVKNNHPAVLKEISNYHPNLLGKKNEELTDFNLSYSDCQLTIANEYGFKHWEDVERLGNMQYDFEFEKTVNALLCGNFDLVKKQISKFPRLISIHSRYGHRATLLHYVGSNGVEMWRQKVPLNLVEMTKYLLSIGANKNAKMKVYGGEFDTYSLLTSSAHPEDAGLVEDLKRVFEKD